MFRPAPFMQQDATENYRREMGSWIQHFENHPQAMELPNLWPIVIGSMVDPGKTGQIMSFK